MSLSSATFIISLAAFFTSTFAASPEKIVGGMSAREGEFPYQVSLRKNGVHFCGGSIIGKKYILTAAHCIQGIVNPPYYDITVITGTNYLSRGGEIHRIVRVTIHPQYTPGPTFSWHNDIAIIKLTKPITFNSKQRAINLSNATVKAGSAGVVSGWGLQSVNSKVLPDNLQKMNSVVSLGSTCQKYYIVNIYREHLCATQKVGIGACMGDSGGPLAVNEKVVGVVSFSQPCGVGVPDVYTNVYEYLSFIKMEMNK